MTRGRETVDWSEEAGGRCKREARSEPRHGASIDTGIDSTQAEVAVAGDNSEVE